MAPSIRSRCVHRGEHVGGVRSLTTPRLDKLPGEGYFQDRIKETSLCPVIEEPGALAR